ncbi:Mitochondrial distribution and morphology protein [Lachnellula hyalina]|uniref:Mitochondrial distribution and morphology protein 12 n=1 Tax=Lachnellula hyalina TaxID=1316788 RepID=A0A8H8R7P7_9HELO|nr:Mitochondrial distribution and morphology protein [Lachnellula hyalina]TVY30000.1 Mitochondrial distribution and morphology protein [Lachnellula hyalina]
MSIDLNWETLTSGPDGIALAEKIRDFIDGKFQTITLPRFIKSVNVHNFEFGSISPEIELKDLCDPLPEFYEETEDNHGNDGEDEDDEEGWSVKSEQHETLRERRRLDRAERTNGTGQATQVPPYINTRLSGVRSTHTIGDLGSPFLGVSTPGIPGGTSNLGYFHSHLTSGLSGAHTPLAAVAGAHLPNGWPDYSSLPLNRRGHHQTPSGSSLSPPPTADSNQQMLRERASVSTLAPSTSTTRPQTREGLMEETVEEEPISPPRRFREPRVEDLQTVFRVRYAGDVRLSLTAEILLDYPMPSFVGIPVKLNITGVSFDGVAVLAHIRKRAHFCFLSPEDAYAAIGTDEDDQAPASGMKMGGLLHEIKVESEIGQRENGKQVLKNVGKVEKFVLEQVRRIFEDEFVYPSFWTFLV